MTTAPAQQDEPRARRDWSARARLTAIEALRYTRFVSWMRRGLSLGAFAVIFAVLAFFFVQRQPRQLAVSYEKMGHVENDLAMMKPRLTGSDDKGNPFVITADAAIQDPRNTKRASLRNIEADVAMNGGSWVNARAKTGHVDMGAGKLELTGGIDLYSDNGYELHTERAFIDLGRSIAMGDRPVTGRGPLGAIRADTFQADRQTNQLLLTGNVRMTIIRRKS
jgi:lipopolysaccharide export system protein LptC